MPTRSESKTITRDANWPGPADPAWGDVARRVPQAARAAADRGRGTAGGLREPSQRSRARQASDHGGHGPAIVAAAEDLTPVLDAAAGGLGSARERPSGRPRSGCGETAARHRNDACRFLECSAERLERRARPWSRTSVDRERCVPDVGDQHVRRRVGDRDGRARRAQRHLRGHAASPEDRQLVRCEDGIVALPRALDVLDPDAFRHAEMDRRTVHPRVAAS